MLITSYNNNVINKNIILRTGAHHCMLRRTAKLTAMIWLPVSHCNCTALEYYDFSISS